jgi:hypothetical protein
LPLDEGLLLSVEIRERHFETGVRSNGRQRASERALSDPTLLTDEAHDHGHCTPYLAI